MVHQPDDRPCDGKALSPEAAPPRNRRERRTREALDRLGLTYAELASKPNLFVSEASAYTGMSVSWLNKARLRGDGPPFFKVGRSVLYNREDLDAWLVSKRVRSTSDAA